MLKVYSQQLDWMAVHLLLQRMFVFMLLLLLFIWKFGG